MNTISVNKMMPQYYSQSKYPIKSLWKICVRDVRTKTFPSNHCIYFMSIFRLWINYRKKLALCLISTKNL